MKTIPISYSCTLCGIVDAVVDVPARQEDDDVLRWMKDVSIYLSEDHVDRSPSCHPTTLQDVRIPTENVLWIGGAPINEASVG